MGRCVGGARRKGWWNQALDQAPANEGLTFDDWPPEIRVVTGAKSSGQSADRSGDQSGDQSGAGFRDTDGYAIGRRGRRTKATESRTRATTGRQTSLSSNKMEAATTTKGRVETAPAQPAGGPVKPRKPRKTPQRSGESAAAAAASGGAGAGLGRSFSFLLFRFASNPRLSPADIHLAADDEVDSPKRERKKVCDCV